MTASALLAAVAGALLVGGVSLAVWGMVPQLPPVPRPSRAPGGLSRWWAAVPKVQRWLVLVALVAGVLVALSTGMVVAVVVLPLVVLWLPSLLMTSDEGRSIARLEAIGEWTRTLAGVMTAGQGLEGAITASLRSTPAPIRPEVGRLVARMRARWSTEQALRAFADDVDDVTGDLVTAALILGADKRGDGLSLILTGLAESVAEIVRARRQIEADRAKPRNAARIITGVYVALLAGLALTGVYLAPYATDVGQVLLAVLLTAFAACLAWLRRLSRSSRPPRILGERARQAGAQS